MSEGHASGSPSLTREEITAFLTELHRQPVENLEPLGGGWWSSAWGYRVCDDELVVRIGLDASWYEADRMAMAFARTDLPVPEVREVGLAPDGRAYAISVRHRGGFLEDTPPEQAGALASTLAGLLLALHDVPAEPDSPVLWHQRGAPPCSWRDFLMAGLIDDPDKVVHGWSSTLSVDPQLAALSVRVVESIRALLGAVPERRDLVHGDLLHGNVLVSPDASRVEAVFSWKCSVRGDFLFDAAWCSFWAPWHMAIAAADPLPMVLAAPSVRAEPGALVDAAARHHLYELQIGFTHLGWNIWSGNQPDLVATAQRLSEVLERGPLTLFGDPPPTH